MSLAVTAGGLLLCYVLWRATPVAGKTLNAVLVEQMVRSLPGGMVFAVVTLVSEGALLVVAAQAGFIDGPRVMANLALDSWLPRRLSALSDRLTTANGILLMGACALVALLVANGQVTALIFLYSINAFLTFSLSMSGMLRAWWRRHGHPLRSRRLAAFGIGLALCATILVITVLEKFEQGGWLTLAVTGGLVALCFVVRRHYRGVGSKLFDLYAMVDLASVPHSDQPPPALDPQQPTAALLVGNYSGLGIHTVLNIQRTFPGFFRNLVFISVGAVDSGVFKGQENLERLRAKTENELQQYVALAHSIGLAGTYRCAIGTDIVDESARLCVEIGGEFPRVTFFAGKLIFERENWYHRLLHNDTAFALQKRLQLVGYPLMVMPALIS